MIMLGYLCLVHRNQTTVKFESKHETSTKKVPLRMPFANYRQTSNVRRTFVGNKIVYYSDVVGASPVGAAPTTSSFST